MKNKLKLLPKKANFVLGRAKGNLVRWACLRLALLPDPSLFKVWDGMLLSFCLITKRSRLRVPFPSDPPPLFSKCPNVCIYFLKASRKYILHFCTV